MAPGFGPLSLALPARQAGSNREQSSSLRAAACAHRERQRAHQGVLSIRRGQRAALVVEATTRTSRKLKHADGAPLGSTKTAATALVAVVGV